MQSHYALILVIFFYPQTYQMFKQQHNNYQSSQGSSADESVPRAEGRFQVNLINPLGRLIVRGEEQLMINLIWDAQAGLRLPFIREKGQHGQSESITGKGVLYSNGVNRGDDKRFRY